MNGMSSDQAQVRAIHDALDGQDYERTTQLCTRFLAEKGGSPYCNTVGALKAYALARLGKAQEAYDLASSVRATRPFDAGTLQALTLTYKTLMLFDEIVSLYDPVYKFTLNEEFGMHWFMALVRVGDFKQVQTAAITLHRQFKKSKYMLFNITAMYMQAVDPANADKKLLLLSLAEKMMDKVSTGEEGLPDFEAVRLYLMILESQGKDKEALELLESKLGALCRVESDRERMCLDLLERVGQFDQVALRSKQLLLANADDWLSHVSYIKAIVGCKGDLQESLAFYKSLKEKVSGQKYGNRGPFLGELLLLQSFGKVDANFSGLLGKYVEKFGLAMTCFEDLTPYLELPADLVQEMCDRFQRLILSDDDRVANKVNQTRLNATCKKLLRYYNHSLTVEETKQEVCSLVKLYREAAPLGLGLDERDNQYGDDFLVLSAHYVIDLYARDRSDTRLLFDAIALLEYGLEKSKFNYVFKLTLIRLYFEVGAPHRALALGEQLDIKQIQVDSVSYMVAEDVEVFGVYNEAMECLQAYSLIYDRNETETPDMTIHAFKHCTFSKIPEFVTFRDKVRYSLQKTVTQRQLVRVELLRQFDSIEVLENSLGFLPSLLPLSEQSLDNRDKSVLTNFTNETDICSLIRGEPFPQDRKIWAKVHSICPLLLQKICSDNPLAQRALKEEIKLLVVDGSTELLGPKLLLSFANLVDEVLKDGEVLLDFTKIYGILAQVAEWSEAHAAIWPKALGLGYNACKSLMLIFEALNYACICILRLNQLYCKNGLHDKKATLKAPTDKVLAILQSLQSVLKERHQMHKSQEAAEETKKLLFSVDAGCVMAVPDLTLTARIARHTFSSWAASTNSFLRFVQSRVEALEKRA